MVFSEQLGLYINNFTQLLGLLNLCSGKIYSDMVSTFFITHFPIMYCSNTKYTPWCGVRLLSWRCSYCHRESTDDLKHVSKTLDLKKLRHIYGRGHICLQTPCGVPTGRELSPATCRHPGTWRSVAGPPGHLFPSDVGRPQHLRGRTRGSSARPAKTLD